MKLDDFIANALQGIETGLHNAGEATGKDFYITSTGGNVGVSFDIAVTAKDTTSAQAGGTTEGAVKGGLKIGFVEVVSANVGSNVESRVEQRNENSEVSRIQFTVYMPSRTRAEIQQDNFLTRQRDTSIDDPY